MRGKIAGFGGGGCTGTEGGCGCCWVAAGREASNVCGRSLLLQAGEVEATLDAGCCEAKKRNSWESESSGTAEQIEREKKERFVSSKERERDR